MQSVTSNAVYNAIGGTWTTLTILSSGNYIEYTTIASQKIVHVHLQGYLSNTSLTIGKTIYTVTDTTLRPTSVKRAVGAVDLVSSVGRYALDMDYQSDGKLNVYPIVANKYTGSIGTIAGMFGDFFFVIN